MEIKPISFHSVANQTQTMLCKILNTDFKKSQTIKWKLSKLLIIKNLNPFLELHFSDYKLQGSHVGNSKLGHLRDVLKINKLKYGMIQG